MKLKRILAILLAAFMLISAAGCAGGQSATGIGSGSTAAGTTAAGTSAEKLDPVTLKIMIPGDRPADMDKVLAEIVKQGADAVNVTPDVTFVPWADLGDKTQLTLTSGEDIDLIFDAPWLHIDKMITQGMYEQLDDLISQYGQDLYKVRPQQMWDANKFEGKIMGIPMGTTFSGTRYYYIRKDIREKLGVAPIKTHEDLVNFLYTVKEKEPGIIPYSMDKGALDNSWTSWYIEQQNSNPEKVVNHNGLGDLGMSFLFYTEGKNSTTIKNIFDNPNDIILNAWKEARKLYQDKIINQDILADNQSGKVQFEAGKCAVTISNDAVTTAEVNKLKAAVPTAEMESFNGIKFEPKAIVSDFKQSNFLCIPKVSKNKERAVMFLNWANSSQDIYDLFAYGIKGVNWEDTGNQTYRPLQGYSWFPYDWVWNPAQDRLDSGLTKDAVEINKFMMNADNFEKSKLAGFSFKSDAVANEMAIFNNTQNKYMAAVATGVVDPDETLARVKKEAYDAIKKIQAELQKQIDAHVAANN